VDVLPGASAVVTAAAASGWPAGVRVLRVPPAPPAGLATLSTGFDAGLAIVAFESRTGWPRTPARSPSATGRRGAVCRELTKLHEECAAARSPSCRRPTRAPKGEVTLVLAAADATGRSEPTDAALRELADALGSRRAASLAARLTGLPRNRLYAAITREKR
jgi:16S rRNA (cytidine1402-2'-O)-methyltransferase